MNMSIGNWFQANLSTLSFTGMIIAICLVKIVREIVFYMEAKEDNESIHSSGN